MKYEDMSDLDINKKVADVLGLVNVASSVCGSKTAIEHSECNWSPRPLYKRKDYCNNPSDAWPIIIGNDIGIYPININHEWTANRWAVGSSISGVHANPLRAAMIVFLKMQDSKS